VQRVGRIFSLILVGLVTAEGSASPFMAAFGNSNMSKEQRVRGLQTLPSMYVRLEFAPVPSESNSRSSDIEPPRFLEPNALFIPVTVGVYEAKNWVITTRKGQACFPPEDSLVYVDRLYKTKLVGNLSWPINYPKEGARCPDRVLPVNNQCADGSAPGVLPCADGAMVLIDFSEAIYLDGSVIDPGVLIEKIRQVLRN
jgi:hypothetical protein